MKAKKNQTNRSGKRNESTMLSAGQASSMKRKAHITYNENGDLLSQSEHEYRTIFETTGTGTIIVEEDMIISRVNNEFTRLSGYSKKQIEGKKTLADLFEPDSLKMMTQYHSLRRMDPSAAPRSYECKLADKEGTMKTLLATVSMIPGTQRSVASFLDITKRKATEERESTLLKEIQSIFENIPLGIAYLDKTFRYISMNKYFCDLTQCKEEDLVGKTCYDTIGEYAGGPSKKRAEKICSFCKMEDCFKFREPIIIERPLWDKYVRVTTVPELDDYGNIYRFIEIFEDITEQKRGEEKNKLQQQQLLMVDKMKSLGILVSGIAHEINNPNNYILLNAKIISRVWNDIFPIINKYFDHHGDFSLAGMPYSKARERIDELIVGVADGAMRIQKIIEGLKDFARQDRGILNQTVKVNDVVESGLLITNNLVKKSTQRFTVSYGHNLPAIKGNFQQLEQVVINLITNACHALTRRDQKIAVSTSCNRKSQRVLINVKDEGVGISAEHLKRIFDPFFTTKRDLGGTGLGLSISYNIVREHGGDMKYVSIPEKGTTATVILPVTVINNQ